MSRFHSMVVLLVLAVVLGIGGGASAAPFSVNGSLESEVLLVRAGVGAGAPLNLGSTYSAIGDTDTLQISGISIGSQIQAELLSEQNLGPIEVSQTVTETVIVDPPGFDPPYEQEVTTVYSGSVSADVSILIDQVELSSQALPSVLDIDPFSLKTSRFAMGTVTGRIARVDASISLDGNDVYSASGIGAETPFQINVLGQFVCGGDSQNPSCVLSVETAVVSPTPLSFSAFGSRTFEELFGVERDFHNPFTSVTAYAQVVPEPGTALLIALGLAVLSSRRGHVGG